MECRAVALETREEAMAPSPTEMVLVARMIEHIAFRQQEVRFTTVCL